MINLSVQQSLALEIIVDFSNKPLKNDEVPGVLILTGEKKSGKSLIVEHAIQKFDKLKIKYVFSTAKKFSSVLINKETSFLRNPRESHRWERLTGRRLSTVDIVLIDDFSELSTFTFSLFDKLAKKARGNNRFLGGLKLVAACDFFDVGPVDYVSPAEKNYTHSPAFLCNLLTESEPKFIYLKNENFVFTSAPDLEIIRAIRSGDVGRLSSSESFMKLCQNDVDILSLKYNQVYAVIGTKEAEENNLRLLKHVPGYVNSPVTLDAVDRFDASESCLKKVLKLGVGVQVVFLKDVSVICWPHRNDKFSVARGTLAVVHGFADKLVIVQTFPGTDQPARTYGVSHYTDHMKIDRIELWSRTQYPLAIAFYIPIRWIIGINVTAAVVDVSHIFNNETGQRFGKGLLYSAICNVHYLEGMPNLKAIKGLLSEKGDISVFKVVQSEDVSKIDSLASTSCLLQKRFIALKNLRSDVPGPCVQEDLPVKDVKKPDTTHSVTDQLVNSQILKILSTVSQNQEKILELMMAGQQNGNFDHSSSSNPAVKMPFFKGNIPQWQRTMPDHVQGSIQKKTENNGFHSSPITGPNNSFHQNFPESRICSDKSVSSEDDDVDSSDKSSEPEIESFESDYSSFGSDQNDDNNLHKACPEKEKPKKHRSFPDVSKNLLRRYNVDLVQLVSEKDFNKEDCSYNPNRMNKYADLPEDQRKWKDTPFMIVKNVHCEKDLKEAVNRYLDPIPYTGEEWKWSVLKSHKVAADGSASMTWMCSVGGRSAIQKRRLNPLEIKQ
jgi:hypothetical protein